VLVEEAGTKGHFVNLKLHDNKAPGDRQKAAWRIAASHATKLSFSSPSRLVLEIDIGELLPGAVLHDEAGVVEFFDRPRRREAAGGAMRCNLRHEMNNRRRYASDEKADAAEASPISSKAAVTNFADGFMGLSGLCCFVGPTFARCPRSRRVRSRNDMGA
jgi:hypothetical protein